VVPGREHEIIYKRAKEGESQKSIAADYGVTRQQISKIVKRIEIKKTQKTPELPKGEFDVILADPPWEFDFSDDMTRGVENQYPTIKLEEICKLKVPAADNSILFLWVPPTLIRQGIKVLEAWGFSYKAQLVWVKDKIGMGFWVRYKHELILIGGKGNIAPPEPNARPSSVIISPRKQHSQKPDELYEIIEQMYPKGKYLELYATRTRKGWASWGNEVGD